MREAAEKYNIDKVFADKAHDNRKNSNLLDDLNVEPAIEIRNNASTKARGCPLRRDEVLLNQETWLSEMERDQRLR